MNFTNKVARLIGMAEDHYKKATKYQDGNFPESFISLECLVVENIYNAISSLFYKYDDETTQFRFMSVHEGIVATPNNFWVSALYRLKNNNGNIVGELRSYVNIYADLTNENGFSYTFLWDKSEAEEHFRLNIEKNFSGCKPLPEFIEGLKKGEGWVCTGISENICERLFDILTQEYDSGSQGDCILENMFKKEYLESYYLEESIKVIAGVKGFIGETKILGLDIDKVKEKESEIIERTKEKSEASYEKFLTNYKRRFKNEEVR